MSVADAAEGPAEGEEAFMLWMKNVWTALGIADSSISNENYSNSDIREDSGGQIQNEDTRSRILSPLGMRSVFSLRPSTPSLRTRTQTLCFGDLSKFKVVDVRQLTLEGPDTQQVCHVTLASACVGEPLRYESGDHLEVGCMLHAETVEYLCLRLGLNLILAWHFILCKQHNQPGLQQVGRRLSGRAQLPCTRGAVGS